MMELMKALAAFASARLNEASTMAGAATMLTMLHIQSTDANVKSVSMWCAIASGIFAVLVRENGKSKTEVMTDLGAAIQTTLTTLAATPPPAPAGSLAIAPQPSPTGGATAAVLVMLALPGALLMGCASGGKGPTPLAAVAALESALAAADTLALNYAQLPRCSSAAPPLCSQQAIVDQIKAKASIAYAAVNAAKAAVIADPAAAKTPTAAALKDAELALATLQATVPKVAPAAPGK